MHRSHLSHLALAVLALAQLSCAVGGGAPDSGYPPRSMPAAREALRPDQRGLYDALEDEGDWVLIEPYGQVFRPRVNFVAWRPFTNGYWLPTDVYGWVWQSNDDFGWITDHYGFWFYDAYQGWVWRPGLDWGPGWVAWAMTDNYAGWAPLAPPGYDAWDEVPEGPFTFAPYDALVSRSPQMDLRFVTNLPNGLAHVEPVFNFARYRGVVFNRGPNYADVETRSHASFVPNSYQPRRLTAPDPSVLGRPDEVTLRRYSLAAFNGGIASTRRFKAPAPPAPKPGYQPMPKPILPGPPVALPPSSSPPASAPGTGGTSGYDKPGEKPLGGPTETPPASPGGIPSAKPAPHPTTGPAAPGVKPAPVKPGGGAPDTARVKKPRKVTPTGKSRPTRRDSAAADSIKRARKS